MKKSDMTFVQRNVSAANNFVSLNRISWVRNQLLLPLMLLISIFGNSQYDAFNWEKSALTSGTVEPYTDLTTDQFGRIYYIDKNTNHIVLQDPNAGWFAYLNTSAPLVRDKSNLVYKNDAIFYVNETDQVTRIYWNGSQWDFESFPSYPIAMNSKIDVISENNFFYIRESDGQVCQYWNDGSSFGFTPINTGAIAAVSWSNLHFVNDHVFYIGLDNEIHYHKWNSTTSSWSNGMKPSGPIAFGSKIHAQNENQIFYLRNGDNLLSAAWETGGSTGFGPLRGDIVPAAHATNIHYDNNKVYYINEKGNLHVAFWQGCEWVDNELNETSYSKYTTHPFFAYHDDQIFYVNTGERTHRLEKVDALTNFVYRQGTDLMLNGEKFEPIGICYIVDLYTNDDGNTIFAGPHTNSVDPILSECNTDPACNLALQNQIADIANLGFNSIRFGLSLEANASVYDSLTGTFYSSIPNGNWITDENVYFKAWDLNLGEWKYFDVSSPTERNKLFGVMDEVFSMAEEYGLKTHNFVGLKYDNTSEIHDENYYDYLGHMAEHFKDNSAIYAHAYGLEMNIVSSSGKNAQGEEVLRNFISDKVTICSHTTKCYDAIRAKDKNHLITTSSAGAIAANENWDAKVMKTDFMTFHLYPQNMDVEYLGVKRELYWINNIMYQQKKPWMIGETGYLGIDDYPGAPNPGIGTESMQRDYGVFALDASFKCRAFGVQWWQYSDVDWGKPISQNHYGIKRIDGLNKVNKEILSNNIFDGYVAPQACGQCVQPINYYEEIPGGADIYYGYVYDDYGNPLKDAIVRGVVDASQTESESTFTDANGFFLLRTNFSWGLETLHISYPGKLNSSVPAQHSSTPYILFDVPCKNLAKTAISEQEEGKESKEEQSPSGIPSSVEDVSLRPNPTAGQSILSLSGKESGHVLVLSLEGKEILSTEFENQREIILNTGYLPAGLYWINIRIGDNIISKKLVKQ